MKIRTLFLAFAFCISILGFGGKAFAYSTAPSWMPMDMLDITFDSTTNKLAITTSSPPASLQTNTNGMGSPATGIASFDPAAVWGVLNHTAFSRLWGWNDPNAGSANISFKKVETAFGAGNYIWIESVSKTPGLNTYQAVGSNGVADGNTYPPIFGTSASSTKWKWDGEMDHNTYSVPFSYLHAANQPFSATYKIYVGDITGVENPAAASASTTTTWYWQGPAFVFPTKINQTAGEPVVSGYVDLALIPGLAAGPFPISITGGEYSIWTPAGGWGAYTSTAGTITNQDSVRVRVTASATPGATTTATVAIAALSGPGEFKVITAETAGTLAPITFTSLTGVEPSTLVESSDSYTVSGITGASAIAGVSTGSFAVSSDGGATWGAWISVGSVANGDKIKVRFISSGSPSTAASTKLTIVGVAEGTFTTTTNAFSGPPTWMPMTMLNISLANNQLAIVEEATKSPFSGTPPTPWPSLSTVAATSKFNPLKIWSVLNGSAYSRRLGWNPAAGLNSAAVKSAFGSNAGIWIERLSQSAGLETYQAVGTYGVNANGTTEIDPSANGYAPIFGTAGSSTKWKWDYLMDHNTYAVPAAYITTPNQIFSATYKIYVGDDAGVEIPAAASAGTTTTWTWQGPATVPDITPDAFSFASKTGAALTTVVESAPITVAGIDASALISITGGEYAVSTNGGTSWSVYSTSAPLTIANGNQVKVRLTSSAVSETTTTATLTIGGGTGTFSVTTGDSVPDSFTFTNLTDVATDYYYSNAITVSGITIPSPITISSGSRYSVSTNNGSTWSTYSATTPAIVNNGDQVKVRLTAAQTPGTTTTATLTIGGVSGNFSVTTNAYSGPPTWMPMTMLNISLNSGKLAIQELSSKSPFNTTPPSFPVLSAPISNFDPSKPWNVISGSAFSRRLGWNPAAGFNAAAVTAAFGADAGIWIERISQTPGLETYQAVGTFGVNANNSSTVDPAANGYAPIFGTAGSSTKWKWDYQMDHNIYAVPAAYLTSPNQLFSATYKIYVGDAAGVEIPAAATVSTTTTWGWQGSPLVFPTKINQTVGAVVQSSYIRISGAATGPQAISITGGEYAIWPSAGMELGPWTNAPGTISNGDWVIVRVTASATPGATTIANLSIASLAGPGIFRVITAETAGSLAAIPFTSKINVEPSSLVESTEIYTVPVNTARAVTGVSSGSFAVSSDGGTTWGAWTSVGTVASGDKVKVRFTSSESPSTAASTTLTIVGIASGTFTATTNAFAGPPTWMPMTMLDVTLSSGKFAVMAAPTMYPVLSTVASLTSFDPAKPWAVLNGSAYSRELGWNPGFGLDEAAVTTAFGPTAGIWIERISQSAGLETYQAIGEFGVNANDTTTVDSTANGYAPIFGTAGSSTRWKWDYQMDHNTYAVPAAYITAPNQLFSATYKIFVGDATGVEIPAAVAASTTTTWTWQGPATVPNTTPATFSFPGKSGASGSVIESAAVTVTGIDSSALISISGGEYSVSANGGANWSTYSTVAPATVAVGSQVKVRQTASAASGTSTTATLTIGGKSGSFTVTSVKRNGNGGTGTKPTVSDALKALQGALNPASLSLEEKIRYDVAPLSSNGAPLGNGAVDIADVIMILRRSIDIGTW
jgi:hypothetical protein